MSEADLGNGRSLVWVAGRGTSGAWNNLRPNQELVRLQEGVEITGKIVQQIKEGRVKPHFFRLGGTYAPDYYANKLLDYIGHKGDLAIIMGNREEVDIELEGLVKKYLPKKWQNRYNYNQKGVAKNG